VSLRGVDTHGIVLAERYIEGLKSGEIKKRPLIRIARETTSTAVLDGGGGLGAYLASTATRMAIRKAKRTGVGSVSLVNLTHCGALSYYGLKIAEKGLIGTAFTNSSYQAAPWGGSTPIFGTNPLCVAFPFEEGPIVLDIATTTAAGQKIVFAIRDKKSIPEGWALDSEGNPTTDPGSALRGAMLPFGGHKGYGLMFASEVYSAILSGGKPSYSGVGRYFQGGFFVQATKVSAFRPYRSYMLDMSKLAAKIRSSRVAKGFERVYLPGELELVTTQKRLKEGIPVDPETWAYFQKIAADFGLTPPKPE
jgi:ureidoglycolate dehydrogenase (NAD+)